MRCLIFSDIQNKKTAESFIEETKPFLPLIDENIYLGQTKCPLPKRTFQTKNLQLFNNREIVAFGDSLVNFPNSQKKIAEKLGSLYYFYPYCKIFASRLTKKKGIYSLNSQSNKTRFNPLKSEIKTSNLYLINPGSIEDPNDNSFAILDTKKNRVKIYTLQEIEEINLNKFLLDFYENNIWPYLKGDKAWTLDIFKTIEGLKRLNKNNKLESIIQFLTKKSPFVKSTPEQLREYHKGYSLRLAEEFDKFATEETAFVYGIDSKKDLWFPTSYWELEFEPNIK